MSRKLLTLFYLILTMILSGSAGWILFQNIQVISNRWQESIEKEFKTHSTKIAHAIEAQIFERYGDAQALAMRPDIATFLENPTIFRKNQITQTLNRFVSLYDVYDLSLILDLNGRVVASNSLSPNNKKLNERTISNFRLGMNDSTDFPTIIGDFSWNPLLEAFFKKPSPAISFMSKVKNSNGITIGWVVNLATPLFIERDIQIAKNDLKTLELDQVEISIFNGEQSKPIAFYGNDKINYLKNNWDPNLIPIELVKTDTTIYKDFLYSLATLKDIRIPNLPQWKIMIRTPTQIVFKNNLALKKYSLLITFLGLSVILGCIGFLFYFKHKQEKLFNQKMMVSIEKDRSRISTDIHDELGQNLTAVKFSLMKMKQRENPPPSIDLAIRLIEESNASIRRLSIDLHPSILTNLGLTQAIEWKSRDLSESTQIQISTSITNSLNIDNLLKEHQFQIYRIVQESLNNSLKYSKATEINVNIKLSPKGAIIVEIIDNGVGLIENQDPTLGLSAMKERAQILSGTLTVKNRPEDGVIVQLIFVPKFMRRNANETKHNLDSRRPPVDPKSAERPYC